MVALTRVPVIPHQQHLVLQIIDLKPQTNSVVLRVSEKSGQVLYICRESNPFEDLDTRDIIRGM